MKRMHHIEIHPATAGKDGKEFAGAHVERHFEPERKGQAFMTTHEPETKHFGEHEGEEMLTHVASLMGMQEEGEAAAKGKGANAGGNSMEHAAAEGDEGY